LTAQNQAAGDQTRQQKRLQNDWMFGLSADNLMEQVIAIQRKRDDPYGQSDHRVNRFSQQTAQPTEVVLSATCKRCRHKRLRQHPCKSRSQFARRTKDVPNQRCAHHAGHTVPEERFCANAHRSDRAQKPAGLQATYLHCARNLSQQRLPSVEETHGESSTRVRLSEFGEVRRVSVGEAKNSKDANVHDSDEHSVFVFPSSFIRDHFLPALPSISFDSGHFVLVLSSHFA
jgi:hypothetical protein